MNILAKIIEKDGDCSWAKPAICKQCPMSRLRQKADGNYFSCIESLGVQDMSEEMADAIYKEVASRLLMNQVIDDLLIQEEGDDGDK